MMRIKKYLPLLLSLFLLCACGQQPPAETSQAQQTTATQTQTQAQTPPETEPATQPSTPAESQPAAQQGRIYLYGEAHSDDYCLEKELELWGEMYARGERHLFVELPFYTADYLNRWMQADSDDILYQIYDDSKGTQAHSPNVLVFFRHIKDNFPETIFHGTDVGHQYNSTGERYLAELRAAGQENSEAYARAQKIVEQGRIFYEKKKQNDAYAYRENCMAENFILEYEKLSGANVMGIYGAAHTDPNSKDSSGRVPSMAGQLAARYGEALHAESLLESKPAMEALRRDVLRVGGKEYEADYFGDQDLTFLGLDYQKRDFWRLENAYEDFASCPLSGEVLPYDNYPMPVETGQVFVIDYTMKDGSVERRYYRSDGAEWNGRPTTQDFTLPENTPVTDFSNPEYKTETISFSEKESDFEKFSISRQMKTVCVNGRTYCFDTNIPETECREQIRFTEELLMKAGITREFRICLYNVVKMKHTYVENGSLYCRMGHMSDIDYLTAVLLAAYGEFANYGMAYGYAGLLLGEDIPEAIYPEDWDYYDLNLLCFSPDFCDEEKLNNNKAIALDFASAYVEKHGHAAYQDLLEKSGQLETAETARVALAEHYKNYGVEPELSPLLYALGGTSYSHILRCEYATFYTERDFEDINYDIIFDTEDWEDLTEEMYYGKTSYKSYRKVFEGLRMDMKQYQDFFNLYPYRNSLSVILIYNDHFNPQTMGGYYFSAPHQIYLTSLYSFSHEYVHSLIWLSPKTGVQWVQEGLTRYYERRFSSYANVLYAWNVEAEAIYDEKMRDVSARYLETLGRPFDPVQDEGEYLNLVTYFYDFTVYDSPYVAGAAFIHYLITEFGEREVLDYFLDHHDLSRLTDKSMEELMDAWKSYLEERFQEYGKAAEAGEP